MFWIERPDKLAAVCRAGESYTDSMISIPITDEAYEALKAKIPQIDQDQTSRGRNGQLRIWVDWTFLDQLLHRPYKRAPPDAADRRGQRGARAGGHKEARRNTNGRPGRLFPVASSTLEYRGRVTTTTKTGLCADGSGTVPGGEGDARGRASLGAAGD